MSQLKAGALLSYLSVFFTIIIALIYTPIMIRLLGQSEFGLYSLIGSMAAYFSVMDMGLGNAMIRYTARNRSLGDKNSEANLNGLFLSLYIVIGIITTIVGIVVYFQIENIFGAKLTPIEISKAKVMVIILTINFGLSFPLSIFTSILRAYERFIIDKLVLIVRSLMSPIIILPLLYLGFGSISMVVITTTVNILSLTFVGYYCYTRIKIKITFGKIDFSLLKEIIGYSFFVFLGVIIDQIYWNTDQFILGIVSGTVAVAVYAIAIQFIRLYMQFSSSISGLFLPKVSMMVAENSSAEDLSSLFVKFGRIQYLVISYIMIGFILFGHPFIIIWAGENYSDAYYIALIIMIPLSLPLIQNTGLAILYAKNLQKFRAVVLLIIAILNVVISIPLAKLYGGIGIAVVSAATLTIGHIIVMNIYYYKKVQINIPFFWKNILSMTLPMTVPLLLGVILNLLINQNTILFIGIKIILFSIIHIFTLYVFVLNTYEKNLFNSVLNRFKNVKKA